MKTPARKEHLMPSLHALYDALVSINVPTGKALAVVESMERDMLAQLATKPDVQHVQLLMRSDLDGVRKEMKAEIDGLRKEVKADIDGLRKEFKADMALLQSTMTIRLGSLQIVGMSLMFAALKLT
jgi:hypothetical protein